MDAFSYSRYRQYYQQLGPALKKPHVRAYTMAALSFFALSFFGAFAIRPSVKEIFELNRKIEDRTLVKQKLDEKIKNLQKAEGEYQKIQADLSLILAALPGEADFPPLLKSLEAMATSSAVSLSSLKFQDIALLGNVKKGDATSSGTLTSVQSFPFALAAETGYPNVLSFIEELEKGKRLVNIEEVNLNSEKVATTEAELRVGVKAQAYFAPHKIKVIE